jgi:hypothetical protein
MPPKISESAFLEAAMTLKLQIRGYDDRSTSMGRLFAALGDESGFNMHKIIILSLLLSKGNAGDKSILLFDLFDQEMSRMLSRERFIKLMEIMIDLS